MGENKDFFALDWIKGEIDTTLDSARRGLEAYVESNDIASMRACLAFLHQVNGTLLMLELKGVATLSSEMENLAHAMLKQELDPNSETQQLLMQGILQLPAFLEDIQDGRADRRQAVLPLANEMRLAQGGEPFGDYDASQGNLYQRPSEEVLDKFDKIDGRAKTQRIRRAFQQVLLSVIKGERLETALSTLGKVAAGMERLCVDTPAATLFQAFGGFVESLSHGEAQLDKNVIKLLRQIDVELKNLAREGRKALKRPVRLDLIRRFIEAAEERDFISEQLEQISSAIDQADKTEPATISTRDAANGAAIALREELLHIRDSLDLCFRGGVIEQEKIQGLAEPLKKIGSTLAVLGFESSRSIIADQIERLGALATNSDADESSLMSIASSLLQVDENLSGITSTKMDETGVQSQGSLIGDAQIAVILEVRRGLETVKLKVVQYASTQWDADHLAEVPELLMGARGALAMVPLSRPADLLEQCAGYVEKVWLAGNKPDWQTLDIFADAISGVDYYLERLSENTVPKADDILNLVEQSLSQLLKEEPAISAEAIEEPALLTDIALDLVLDTTLSAPIPDSGAISSEKDRPDEEIIEIFVEEVGEVLSNIATYFPRWQTDATDREALTELRRNFHTLKGSGRIVTADLLGELSWSIENLLNRVFDGTLQHSSEIVSVTDDARQLISPLCVAFENALQSEPEEHVDTAAAIIERADILASGGTPDSAVTEEFELLSAMPSENSLDEHTEDFASFDAQASAYMQVLKEFVDEHSDAINSPVGKEVVHAARVLNDSAMAAGIEAIVAVSDPICEVVNYLDQSALSANREHLEFLLQSVYALESIFSELRDGLVPEEDGALFAAEADRLLTDLPATQPVSILGLDSIPVLLEMQEFIENWKHGIDKLDQRDRILGALREIASHAELINYVPVTRLSGALQDAIVGLMDKTPDQEAFTVLDQAQEMLLNSFDCVAAQQQLPPVDDLVERLAAFVEITEMPAEIEMVEDDVKELVEELLEETAEEFEKETAEEFLDETTVEESSGEHFDLEAIDISEESSLSEDLSTAIDPDTAETADTATTPVLMEVASEPRGEVATHLQDNDSTDSLDLPEEIDTEIVEIYFEEADELIESMEQSVNDWKAERQNELPLENLLRVLHTLKGGARLAGLTSLGDLTHGFESFLVALQNRGFEPDDEFFSNVHGRVDNVTNMLARYKQAISTAIAQPESLVSENVSLPEPVEADASGLPDAAVIDNAGLEDTDTRDGVGLEVAGEEAAELAPKGISETSTKVSSVKKVPPKEMVRVSSLLLEKLVNLAGESSIIRSRVEQTIGDFGQALGEMDNTINRLRDQLRRMEIETETQVLFRTEKEGADYTEFDPLEMDRYSRMQEIARSLSESTSDMFELKDVLRVKARDSEMLLIQQARLNSELQEGLMHTRMVPFSRMLPRLKRIVRQVAREVDKEVELKAFNAEGEIDRNIIERMVPPLEHLLRNAIDHGIETAEERVFAGKAAIGRIELALLREGGDMVLELSDDGRGIDIDSVRDKAIERELMHPDANLSDDQILQFILAPGFTTADSVTQLSGRGVGMDVVHSEVKQLGGSVQIASTSGKGTRITLRLPFTVSVNRALMVTVGEDEYAIPLNSIEGIVRVPMAEFEQMNQPGQQAFEYAGLPYRLRFLGSYLGREFSVKADQTSVPIVLVRSGDQAMALFVNSVQGSREIVVKSLGLQFAGVGGVSGATILGDGSVVVILDILSLIRGNLSESIGHKPSVSEEERPRCVMVVDDSVTVRKVTSRLLERQGMEVIVAKDGVEAMELLQEKCPDVMLLDIEMPRMDGFEVARQVRHDAIVSHLPIIMISSRTGAKHQEHAGALGVNKFLGKPFQESELLATIDELLASSNSSDRGLPT